MLDKHETSLSLCRHLTLARDQLPGIVSTLGLGTAVEKTEKEKTLVGFEPYANQRLLPPTFPRYTEIKGRDVAYTQFKDLIANLLLAANVANHSQSFRSALVRTFLSL